MESPEALLRRFCVFLVLKNVKITPDSRVSYYLLSLPAKAGDYRTTNTFSVLAELPLRNTMK
jgi:hypothetical protein